MNLSAAMACSGALPQGEKTKSLGVGHPTVAPNQAFRTWCATVAKEFFDKLTVVSQHRMLFCPRRYLACCVSRSGDYDESVREQGPRSIAATESLKKHLLEHEGLSI